MIEMHNIYPCNHESKIDSHVCRIHSEWQPWMWNLQWFSSWTVAIYDFAYKHNFNFVFRIVQIEAIEENIVRPNLPEDRDRVEQLLVEFRAVQQRIHDLNQVILSAFQIKQVGSWELNYEKRTKIFLKNSLN